MNNQKAFFVIAMILVSIACLTENSAAARDNPVTVTVEDVTVPPSTGPLMHVRVENRRKEPYQGKVWLSGPEGWSIVPATRDVTLGPGESKRVPFTIEKATNRDDNRYTMTVGASKRGGGFQKTQTIICASAPYFKPEIDGTAKEWDDSLPWTFGGKDERVAVRTYWNRRGFSLMVAVNEKSLVPHDAGEKGNTPDAVQFVLAAADSKGPAKGEDPVARYEFLAVATGSETSTGDLAASGGTCFQLAAPGMKAAQTQKARELAPLAMDGSKVAVSRTGGVTFYEIYVPFKTIRDTLKPTEGREIFFSVLVHDPDVTGVRDPGDPHGKPAPFAWSTWPGASWDKEKPTDFRQRRWGLCTSKY